MRSASASTSPAPARLSDSSATPPSTSLLSRAAVENLCSGLMRCSSALRQAPSKTDCARAACSITSRRFAPANGKYEEETSISEWHNRHRHIAKLQT